jgi:molybdenum cofactor cytidylyltransferase
LAGVLPQMIDRLVEHATALDIAAILVEADGSRMLPIKAPADHEPVLPQQTTILVPVLGVDGVGAPLSSDRVHRPETIRRVLSLPSGATQRLTPEFAARLLVHSQGGAKNKPEAARLLPLLNKADTASRLATGRLVAKWLNIHGYPLMIGAVGKGGIGPVRERWSPVAIIILAAGGSTRMGDAKQLIAVDGESMLRRAVSVALASDVERVIVVTGAYRAAVEEILSPLAVQNTPRLSWVHNDTWSNGQAGSIRVGIDHLQKDVDAVLLMPVDQPFLSAYLLRRLVRLWQQGANIATPRVNGQIRGAPALFDRVYWPELRRLHGDVGGRSLLRRYASQVATLDVSPHIVQDVDTPDDLEALCRI